MRAYLLAVLLMTFYLITPLAIAQDDPPAPQFLYRDGNHLVLLNGYTGEPTQLPLEVVDRDFFSWSPDGKYLLARLQDDENDGSCLNLYEVDELEWAYDDPISCRVQDAIFSNDGIHIYYTTDDQTNATLWAYALEDESSRELYHTGEGIIGLTNLQWSPTRTYLTFVSYDWPMSGPLNSFVVMNVESGNSMTLKAPDRYYASYYPIWSPDDHWFLIILKEEYTIHGTFSVTNHQGDVYLVNSETGRQYRLTYTPASYEMDVHWTEDGGIAFTEVTEQNITLTLDEAMKVEVVPDDEIVWPESVDAVNDYDMRDQVMFSPDPEWGAWVQHVDEDHYQLAFGSTTSMNLSADFSVPINSPNPYNNVLIGWRPSDYPYSDG